MKAKSFQSGARSIAVPGNGPTFSKIIQPPATVIKLPPRCLFKFIPRLATLWLLSATLAVEAGPFFTNSPLTIVRVAQTTTLLSGGKLLVAGGYDTTNSIAISELYDPATGLCTT